MAPAPQESGLIVHYLTFFKHAFAPILLTLTLSALGYDLFTKYQDWRYGPDEQD